MISSSREQLDTFKRELAKNFEFRDLGSQSYILGIKIARNMESMSWIQTDYIEKSWKDFDIRMQNRESIQS